MKAFRIAALLVFLVVAALAAAISVSAQGDETCSLPFKATVRSGPSIGTALAGTLDFALDEQGGLTGSLKLADDTEIPVYGQANGRAINLVFDLSSEDKPGVLIFGVGTSLDPMNASTCGTALGGPFVGPQEGDSGDWKAQTAAFGGGDPFEADNKKGS